MSFLRAFPRIKYPIVCAPMANVSGSKLALAVAKAGGLGLIGGGYSIEKLKVDLLDAAAAKKVDPTLEIGFGILTFAIKEQSHIHDLLHELAPTQVVNSIWLFGGDEEKWIKSLKEKFSSIKVIVQVHTVLAARRMVDHGADIIVAQGSDAGGHGGAECSSVISLVPEIIKACPGTPVLAAGGISTGQSMYAAISLGAAGVVVGTRFMLSEESLLHATAKKFACEAVDGGRTTVQTRVYDEMRGTTDWPMAYTGRAIRNKTIEDVLEGKDESEVKTAYKTAAESGDYSRVVCWAGTAVGMVDEVHPASRIVEDMIVEYNNAVDNAPKRI